MVAKILLTLLLTLWPVFSLAGSAQIRSVIGMAIASGGGPTISDDFSSDTSSNYTVINGGITISSGTAKGSNNFAVNLVYNSTSTGSNDHYIELDVMTATSGDESGIYLRSNGTTGYYVKLSSSGAVSLYSVNGSTPSFISSFATGLSISVDTLYKMRTEISGTTFHAYIDLNGDDDFGDANEDLGTIVNSTYTTGVYIGLWLDRGSGGLPTADRLSGDSL